MSIAFVFPGQGSQSVGMIAGLAARPQVRATFDEASAVLGQDLWHLVAQGPEAQLNLTINTQPAMLAAGIATYRTYRAAGGIAPAMVAGHSLGEYTALVVAGSLTFSDAIALVRFRAEAMQSAVPEGVGAMAAILGLDDDAVRAVCRDAAQGEVVEAVNLNSPGQVVIAGHRSAVDRALTLAKERHAKRVIHLPVSVPSHSSLMKPAADRLAAYLAQVEVIAPTIPVLCNADVEVNVDPEKIRDALVRQLILPVRWVETIRELRNRGATRLIECGPGKVLAGLSKRIDNTLPSLAIVDEVSLEAAKQG
ncbi:MAG: ACP S-malonyltransferase [Thiobacillaceae bacterium]